MKTRNYLVPICLVFLTACSKETISITSTPLPVTSTLIMMSVPQTSTPTITPTLVPTLTPKKAEEEIYDFLNNNQKCRFPCFLGVIPGQTQFTNIRDGIYYPKFQSEIELPRSSEFLVENGIVNGIRVRYFSLPELSEQDWENFKIKNILNEYGVPSNIEFMVDEPHEGDSPPNIYWYDIKLNYENEKLIFLFIGGFPKPMESLYICPNLGGEYAFNTLDIWLGESPPNPPKQQLISLEEATSITNEEFHQILTSNDDEYACFYLKKEAFGY